MPPDHLFHHRIDIRQFVPILEARQTTWSSIRVCRGRTEKAIDLCLRLLLNFRIENHGEEEGLDKADCLEALCDSGNDRMPMTGERTVSIPAAYIVAAAHLTTDSNSNLS